MTRSTRASAGLEVSLCARPGPPPSCATTFKIGSCACMCPLHPGFSCLVFLAWFFLPDFFLFLADPYTATGISNSADLRNRESGKLTTATTLGGGPLRQRMCVPPSAPSRAHRAEYSGSGRDAHVPNAPADMKPPSTGMAAPVI